MSQATDAGDEAIRNAQALLFTWPKPPPGTKRDGIALLRPKDLRHLWFWCTDFSHRFIFTDSDDSLYGAAQLTSPPLPPHPPAQKASLLGVFPATEGLHAYAAYIQRRRAAAEMIEDAAHAFRSKLLSDPAYCALRSDRSLSSALELFTTKVDTGVLGRKAERLSRNADFLSLMAVHLEQYVTRRKYPERPVSPARPVREAAERHIRALTRLENKGLSGVSGWGEARRALRSLSQGIKEVAGPGRKRAPRNDQFALERQLIEDLAYAFLVRYEDPLEEVLHAIAKGVGYTKDRTVIADRIKAARVRERKLREPESSRSASSPAR